MLIKGKRPDTIVTQNGQRMPRAYLLFISFPHSYEEMMSFSEWQRSAICQAKISKSSLVIPTLSLVLTKIKNIKKMTAEELKAIENLTNEIKEFNKNAKTLTLLKYVEIRYINSDLRPNDNKIRSWAKEGEEFINSIKDEL